LVAEIKKEHFDKVEIIGEPFVEEIAQVGSYRKYDKEFEKVNFFYLKINFLAYWRNPSVNYRTFYRP
jgi:hypothetical protein